MSKQNLSQFTSYINESFPPLGVPVAIVALNQPYIITIKDVYVNNKSQVYLEGNFVTLNAGQLTIQINILRDGESIINGSQHLIINPIVGSPPLPQLVIPKLITVVDQNVPKGLHTYTFILTPIISQQSSIQILSYATIAKVFNEINSIFVNQDFPLTGIDALVVPPNGTQVVTLNSNGGAKRVRLNVNLNFIFETSEVMFEVNILRQDGTSVTNGPQIFIHTSIVVSPGDFSEANLNLSIVDKTPSSSYVLQLINAPPGTVPLKIDFYSFIAEVVENENKLSVNQVLPQLGDPDALIIEPYSSATIPLEVCVCPSTSLVELILTANVISSQILFNIRKGDESLINGLQLGLLVPPSIYSAEFNSTFIAFDLEPVPGKQTYFADIINIGSNTIGVDYYSFIAEQGSNGNHLCKCKKICGCHRR